MKKLPFAKGTAIISGLGILAWLVTDFYGGMVLYFLSYWWIIFPIILLYLFSLCATIVSLFKHGIKKNMVRFLSHGAVLIGILLYNLHDSELFKSDKILTATLHDDLFNYTLILRNNGECENNISGIFGYHQVYKGEYTFRQDTIVFLRKPYDNDFIPDTLLMDRRMGALFIEKDSSGLFVKEKSPFNHFEIH